MKFNSILSVSEASTSKSSAQQNVSEDEDEAEEEDEYDEVDDEVEETLESKIPKSHECKMVHGDKAITALTIDPSGSRLVSGFVFQIYFISFFFKKILDFLLVAKK